MARNKKKERSNKLTPVNEIARGNPERVLYIIEFPFSSRERARGRERHGRREEDRSRKAEEKPPRFVIAGIYKQYPVREYALCRGFPKRNMVIRAMAHIDMNDACH